MVDKEYSALITDKVDPSIVTGLEKAGYEVKLIPNDSQGDERSEAIGAALKDTPDLVIVRSTDFSAPPIITALDAMPNKDTLFIRAGAGTDNLIKVQKKGFVVENTYGANALSVAELQLGMICHNQLKEEAPSWATQVIKERGIGIGGISGANETLTEELLADLEPIDELQGKKIYIAGVTGAIGSRMATAAQALGLEVISAPDRPGSSFNKEYARKNGITHIHSQKEAFSDADIVSLNVPFKKIGESESPTEGMISQDMIDSNPDCLIINAARPGLIAKGATMNNAIYFDAPENDNLELTAPNAVYGIKVGAKTVEAEKRCADMTVEQAILFKENDQYRHVQTPKSNLSTVQAAKIDKPAGLGRV